MLSMKEHVLVVVCILGKQSEMPQYVGVNITTQQDPLNHLNIYTTTHLTVSPGEYSLSAPENIRMRKSLESSIIALTKPDLNNQIDSKKLTLFRYGVT